MQSLGLSATQDNKREHDKTDRATHPTDTPTGINSGPSLHQAQCAAFQATRGCLETLCRIAIVKEPSGMMEFATCGTHES